MLLSLLLLQGSAGIMCFWSSLLSFHMDRKEMTVTCNSGNVNMSIWIREIGGKKNVNLSVVGFCTNLTTPNTWWWKLLCCSVGLGYYVKAPYVWAAAISLTCDFSADGWSVPGGSDSEYHYVADVHGEGLSWAVHDVQRYRAQHGRLHRWRVKALLWWRLPSAFRLHCCSRLFAARESTFGKMSYLQPMDTRQYLYCLKPKPEFAEKAGVIKGVTVIGKLDIVWKTNLGERGRLQTSQLQRMVLSKIKR